MASIRLTLATLLIGVGGYTILILGVAQIVTPETANGSLITDKDGKVIGSRLIAQKFTKPGYFWPRPSAAGKDGYDAMSAAGSNKSPTSTDVTDRAKQIVAQYGATAEKPLPPELAAASGGGLDPHISEHAAMYQAERVALARGLAISDMDALIRRHAFPPGGRFTPARIVNVLELNRSLDQLTQERYPSHDERAAKS
jgi:K+-transporting ATPase ATPase C chain